MRAGMHCWLSIYSYRPSPRQGLLARPPARPAMTIAKARMQGAGEKRKNLFLSIPINYMSISGIR